MDWDPDFPEGAYCAGQFLFDANDPYKVLDRLDKPFFVPEAAFEKSGQYKDGTVFIEGLAYLKTNCIFIMAVLILKSQLLYVMTTLILSFKIINKFNL